MGEVTERTVPTLIVTYAVTAPGSAGTAATLQSLLTTNQLAEVATYLPIRVLMNPVTNAVNVFSPVPSTGLLSADSNGYPLAAAVNQDFRCVDALKKLFVKSNVAGTTVINISVELVSQSVV